MQYLSVINSALTAYSVVTGGIYYPLYTHCIEVSALYYDCEDRPRCLARYLIEEKSTVRSTAAVFGISKSTVHKDISCRLARIDPILYAEAEKVLNTNKSERHIRGGNATKLKYKSAKCTKKKD